MIPRYLLPDLPTSFPNVSMSLYSSESYYQKNRTGQLKFTQITQSPKQLLQVIGWNNEEEEMVLEKKPSNCCEQGFSNAQHPLATARDLPAAMTPVSGTNSYRFLGNGEENCWIQSICKEKYNTQLLHVPPPVRTLVNRSTRSNHAVRNRIDIRGIAMSSSQHTHSSAHETAPSYLLGKLPSH